LKIIEKFIWQCVFAILLVVCKFLVMKAQHTVASYNGRDFTNKIASVYSSFETRMYEKKSNFYQKNFLLILLKKGKFEKRISEENHHACLPIVHLLPLIN
jgi:hypothetical protein